jgi:carbohydrate-selective porin OprB
MKRVWIGLLSVFLVMGWSGRGVAADKPDLHKEIELLKERIQELEQRLEEQEAAGKKQAVKTEKTIGEKIEETLEERFGTLSLHGGMVLYYQGSHVNELDGENADSPSGAGFAGDLELSWKPAAPAFENGEFYVRVHSANGSGADRDGTPNSPVNVLLGNLNTIADDDSGEGPETGIKMLEAYYTQEFWEGKFGVLAGKTEELHFLDQNAFANDQNSQFVGKPFVNNTVLDSENEYTPVVGATFKPAEIFSASLVGASTSRPVLEDTPLADKQKSKYDNVFSTPFLGVQATVSPKLGELQGNYRLYGWWAGYDHSKLNSDREPIPGEDSKGWGVGVSADQQVTESVGLFGRFGYNNEDVYIVEWEASGGLNLKGLVPGRDDDNIGLGFAALVPGNRYSKDDPECHLELYYRIVVTENLAFTPDLQYVWNPGGDSDNDPIFAPMIRGVFNF